jgi:hypothetical protein
MTQFPDGLSYLLFAVTLLMLPIAANVLLLLGSFDCNAENPI